MVSANASATFALSVPPESDFRMGLRERNEFLQHGRFDHGIVIQEPDPRGPLLECGIRAQIASSTEPRILSRGKNDQSRVDSSNGFRQAIPGAVIHDDHPVRKGFVLGQ